jgi:hypothetical protein
MKTFYKSAVYREAVKTLVIPIFVSTEQAIEWGSRLNEKQHVALATVQCALSDASRAECNSQRKLDLGIDGTILILVCVSVRNYASKRR